MHRIELPDWAVERGRKMNCFDDIEPKRTAFVGIDMQNAFTMEGEVFGNRHAIDIITNVNRLAGAARKAGCPVLWTQQTVSRTPPFAYPEWYYDDRDPFVRRALAALADGAFGHRHHAAMEIAQGDIVLNKYRYSAFIQNASDIESRLRDLAVDTIIIAGTLTNVCCESSARDAYMLGYKVLFATDATAAVTDEEHNASLLNLCLNFADVRTTDALIAMLAAKN